MREPKENSLSRSLISVSLDNLNGPRRKKMNGNPGTLGCRFDSKRKTLFSSHPAVPTAIARWQFAMRRIWTWNLVNVTGRLIQFSGCCREVYPLDMGDNHADYVQQQVISRIEQSIDLSLTRNKGIKALSD